MADDRSITQGGFLVTYVDDRRFVTQSGLLVTLGGVGDRAITQGGLLVTMVNLALLLVPTIIVTPGLQKNTIQIIPNPSGLALNHDLFASTNPSFVPDVGNLIASDMGANPVDFEHTGLDDCTDWYYIARAYDEAP